MSLQECFLCTLLCPLGGNWQKKRRPLITRWLDYCSAFCFISFPPHPPHTALMNSFSFMFSEEALRHAAAFKNIFFFFFFFLFCSRGDSEENKMSSLINDSLFSFIKNTLCFALTKCLCRLQFLASQVPLACS